MKLSEYIQPPNLPLTIGLIFGALAFLMPDETLIEAVFSAISYASLFAWAWLEISSGANWFRRLLGAVVFIALVAGVSSRYYN